MGHAINVTRNNYPMHNNLGKALAKKGKLNEAKSHFRQALKIHPRIPDAYYNLGLVLSLEQRDNATLINYKKALKFNPNLRDAYMGIGISLMKLGRLSEANALFETILKNIQKMPRRIAFWASCV